MISSPWLQLEGYGGYFGFNHGIKVTVSRQIGLRRLQETGTTPQEQCGDILCFSSFFTLESVATVFVHWMEFFLSMKLHNGYTDYKMSPGPE